MRRPMRWGILSGTFLLTAHSLLALALFLHIHLVLKRGGGGAAQAEMAWTFFLFLDPLASLVWECVANSALFTAIFKWGYTWGSGPNLRAFCIFMIFGGAQWCFLGWALGYLVGWIIPHRKR